MPVAIVADAHLGGPGGPAGPLIEQLDALPERGCERLILLGDLFHVWVGLPRFETEEVRQVLAAVGRLRARGVVVEYVEGNRDFFLAGGPYAGHFDKVCLETSFTAGGRRLLAVHGDGLDDRDWRYRGWRWASKSLPSRMLVSLVPARLARRLVDSTERRLAQTNFKHRLEIPRAVIAAYAARRLAEGYDELLLGHFHAPLELAVAGGKARLLAAWFDRREVEWFA